tara:strand:+ start:42 stop:464 length:423 start_codon:yes stop_codon:yes gene_type:complete
MLLINDEELLEGLIGGIGWILAVFYIRNGLYKYKFKDSNYALAGGVSFAIMWYIRKIGMNLYRQYKEITSENKKKQIKLPITKLNVNHIFGLLFAFYLLFYIFIIKMDTTSTKIAIRFSYTEIPLILLVLISMSLIYFSK